MYLFVIALLNLLNIVTVNGIPAWEGGRGTINSLVSGAGYIEALRAPRESDTKHLAIHERGATGSLSLSVNHKAPPLFYVNQGQLWQPVNETTIYRVNVVNTTHTAYPNANFPLKLVLGKKPEGVTGGVWRWSGTMLYYDNGPQTNGGLYYHCENFGNGLNGIYFFLKPSETPPGCYYFTMHSWVREYINNKAGGW
ncbi:hypothetical protein BDN72DRAFT_874163 [Pluteus cervinus]|uniref:Uncharacterized protein n=1 Tax=Pluteus cervinus TaxID=181527 RepID=A0ACD3BDI0_9AGAR|nr:hypothetical protein BDN72DRAFT_874163 [Pluteus cervinus]